MHKAIRTALSVVVSLVLFSALAVAQPSGSKADRNKNKEHHSRLAFWRHFKHADKKTKAPARSKHVQAKRAQVKPASAKQAARKNNQNQNQEEPEQPAPNYN